jgi:hypothetical protein
MKKYEVRFRPLAEADLLRLYEYIAEASGLALARGHIDRLEAACRALEIFRIFYGGQDYEAALRDGGTE